MTFEQEKSVVQLGRHGLAIFLPAVWTKHNEIVKGSRVIIEFDENKIIVRAKKVESAQTIEV